MSLNDKICVVVGASSGVGRAIALKLGKAGAKVIACARRMHLLESLSKEIGPNASAKHLDVTNFKEGVVNVVGSVFAEMRSINQPGHIVVINSDAGRIPFPGLAVYCGTKFFVEGFLRSLRLESKSNEIVITSIQPGDVATPAQQWTTDTEAAQLFSPLHCPPEECRKAWEAMLKPEQVADAVFFAVSQPKGTAINEVLIEPITGPV